MQWGAVGDECCVTNFLTWRCGGSRFFNRTDLTSRGSGRPLPRKALDYGFDALSMKLATLFLSFAKSSVRRYIMWPAS